jgi:hypothetical protein
VGQGNANDAVYAVGLDNGFGADICDGPGN